MTEQSSVEDHDSDDAPSPAPLSSADVIPNHDEKVVRETWLRLWNHSLDPSDVSCRKALDIMAYCFSPAHQLRHLYRYGRVTTCEKAISDVGLCVKVKAKQFESPETVRELLRQSRDHDVVRAPHIWTFRKEPPTQYRELLEQLRREETEEEVAVAAAAAADQQHNHSVTDEDIAAHIEQSDLDKT